MGLSSQEVIVVAVPGKDLFCLLCFVLFCFVFFAERRCPFYAQKV